MTFAFVYFFFQEKVTRKVQPQAFGVWDKFWYFKKVLILKILGNRMPKHLEKNISKRSQGEKNTYYSMVGNTQSKWNLSSKIVKRVW